MKHFLPFVFAVIGLLSFQQNATACIATSAYGTLTASATVFTAQQIESCNYAGEYATVTLPSAGTWTFSSSNTTDYLTVTTTANVGIDSGTTPVAITTTGAMTVRLHIHTNSSCGTQSSCRNTYVTKDPCLATSAYGTYTASASTFNAQTIETCNYAGEYATVTLPAGGVWTFNSSATGDFFVVTTTSNTVLASGAAPLDYTASSAGTVRLHIFTNSSCGTQSTCRVTTVQKSPCLSTTQYPSSMVNAGTTFGSATQISSCNYAGEFALVRIPFGGSWEFNSSDTGDFMVITDQNDQVLASGQVAVQLVTTGTDTVKMHLFTDVNCGTQSTCRTTTVTRMPCLSTSQYPSGVDTNNTTPELLTITTCNYAGEYFELVLHAGETYEFTSSDTNDVFYFTDTNNTFISVQQTAAELTISGTGVQVIRGHLFLDTVCGTQSSCRTTTVKCLTCDVPAPTIDTADSPICLGETSELSASDEFGTLYWFADSCGGTAVDSGLTASVSPTTTTWYYASNVFEGTGSFCDSIEVVVGNNPTVTFSNMVSPLCNGDATGSITAMGDSAVGPYSYLWSNGATSDINDSIMAGTFTVVVTDSIGCETTDTAELSEPSLVDGIITDSADALCNGASSGSATVMGSGGVSPYTYSWSTSGETGASASMLSAGTNTVIITDSNGCVDTAMVEIGEPDALTLALAGTDAVCESGTDGSLSTTVGGGTSGYTYSWSNSETTSSISGLAAGTYSVTVLDANGCETTGSEVVGFQFADPIVAMDDSAILCIGYNLFLDAGSASSYSWSTSESTQSIQVNAGGTYSVTITDANGCSGDHAILVIEEECVGIDEAANLATMEIYPNPAHDVLNVKLSNVQSGQISIELVNMQGQQVRYTEFTNSNSDMIQSIDLNGLAQGMYMINLRLNDQTITHRVMVQ